MDYALNSCRLQRSFGTGDGKVFIRLERFAPTQHFSLTLFGKPLPRSDDSVTVPLRIVFGPNGVPDERERVPTGTSGEKEKLPMLVVESTGLHGRPGQPPYLDQVTEPAAERAINELLIDQSAGGKDMLLQLGPMDKPMAAMRKCTDELLNHWGLDPAVQRTLSSRAAPVESPLSWLKPKDYPRKALRGGESAIVRIRLTVDAAGSATGCTVQSATMGAEFADRTCTLLRERAKFTPARDKDDKPTASYYTTTVTWVIGG